MGGRRMSERKRTKRRGPVRQQASPPPVKRDKRFSQLLDMARGGDVEAVADLWREYGFRFAEDQP